MASDNGNKEKPAIVEHINQQSNGAQDVDLPMEARGQIGSQLRKVYGDMLQEPLPDVFSKLLADLARSETEGK